jgi:hypothetical protein
LAKDDDIGQSGSRRRCGEREGFVAVRAVQGPEPGNGVKYR